MYIHIENFQSLEDISVNADGFTVVTGPSDTGKSAFVRAIGFVMSNNFHKSFIRHNKTTIMVEFDGIKRVKSKKDNYYVIDDKKYDKVGVKVPDEIATKKGYSLFEYEGGSDNTLVVPQYKPLFLVNENEYTQSKMFQSLFGISRYERAVRNINSTIRSLATDLNKLSEEIEFGETSLATKQRKLNEKGEYLGLMEVYTRLEQFLYHMRTNTALNNKMIKKEMIVQNLSNILSLHQTESRLRELVSLHSFSGKEVLPLYRSIIANTNIAIHTLELKETHERNEKHNQLLNQTKHKDKQLSSLIGLMGDFVNKKITLDRLEVYLDEDKNLREYNHVLQGYRITHKRVEDLSKSVFDLEHKQLLLGVIEEYIRNCGIADSVKSSITLHKSYTDAVSLALAISAFLHLKSAHKKHSDSVEKITKFIGTLEVPNVCETCGQSLQGVEL